MFRFFKQRSDFCGICGGKKCANDDTLVSVESKESKEFDAVKCWILQ